MSKQSIRDEFIEAMAQEGIPVAVARTLMRHEATLHRLAELECSSEAADRDRIKCLGDYQHPGAAAETCLCRDYGSFDAGAHGTIPRIAVKGYRVERAVEVLCKAHNLVPIFNGDPRGAAILLKVPSGRTNDWGQRGIAVP